MPRLFERLPLTIVVPVHGRQKLLTRALESIASQSVLPAKVVVVDDCSSPPTIVDAELSRMLDIELVRHEANKGASAARNTGLASVETGWAGFLDSDDYMLGDSLERRWAGILRDQEKRQDATIIYGCGWVEVDTEGAALSLRWPRPAGSLSDFASGCWYSPGSCALFNVEAVRASGIEQDVELRRFEDFDWFLALALAGFSVDILPIAAVAITRERVQRPATVKAATGYLLAKWRKKQLDTRLLTRAESYMALEEAAAFYYAGDYTKAAARLAASLILAPRLSLQLSPGWDRQAVKTVPGHVIER